jgi:hypothetical protein
LSTHRTNFIEFFLPFLYFFCSSALCRLKINQICQSFLTYWVNFYTVMIFLARNGRTRAVKIRPKNFGRISFDLGEISPIQQILRLRNGRDSPISNKFRPKKNYCVAENSVFRRRIAHMSKCSLKRYEKSL